MTGETTPRRFARALTTAFACSVLMLASACGSTTDTASNDVDSEATTTSSAPADTTTTEPASEDDSWSAPNGQPAGKIGPEVVKTVTTQSPLALNPQPSSEAEVGVLFSASNPAYPRSYYFVMSKANYAKVKLASGWTATKVDEDVQWLPGACGGMPNVMVGDRWEVYLDSTYTEVDNALGEESTQANVQLTAFNLESKEFTTFLETPNTVDWFSGLVQLDDHSVGMLFDPDASSAGVEGRKNLVLRSFDLEKGTAVDYPIEVPDGAPYYYADILPTREVLISLTNQKVLVGPVGGPYDEKSESEAFAASRTDGIEIDYSRSESDERIYFLNEAGESVGRILSWRTSSESSAIHAFEGQHAYISALDKPFDQNGQLLPGVYDMKATTWDWVFERAKASQADEYGSSFFVLGVK